jgi:hypothetical protein
MSSLPSTARICAVGAITLAISFVACSPGNDAVSPRAERLAPGTPSFTLGSGSASKLLGRATFSDGGSPNFKVKRMTGDWHVEVKSTSAVDVAVQTIDFAPGGQSGWHSHPGPVFIQVVSGTMTFYDSDDPSCTPVVKTAGQGYLDAGEHAHIARNETTVPAQNVVTYLAPPGVPLRIDAPRPGNCPF